MPNPFHHGLDKRLREIADKFDALCRDHGLQYTIEADTHNEQGYLIHGRDVDHTSVKMYLEDYIKDKWVGMSVEPSKHGSYFKFTVQPIYEYSDDVQYIDLNDLVEANQSALIDVNDYDEWLVALHTESKIDPIVVSDDLKVIDGLELLRALAETGGMHGSGKVPVLKENQYKHPSNKLRRSQAAFAGSSNGPAKTFGGHSTADGGAKAKKKKAVKESIGVEYTLNKPLLAHDNSTIIPKGSKITVVDDDRELPDVRLEDGRIVNVDMAELKLCIKESLDDRLNRVVSEAMVAIAAPKPLMPPIVSGPRPSAPTPFRVDSGNMEAEFDPMGDEQNPIAKRITGALDGVAAEFGIEINIGGEPSNGLVDTLNKLWAGEVAAILQYEVFYVTAPSLHMAALQEVFKEHQAQEQKHARMLTQRISELGGTPAGALEELARLAPHKVENCSDAAGMVSILQYQEQIAVDAYKAAIKQAHAQGDPATRSMLEEILREEEEHLSDMESMIG